VAQPLTGIRILLVEDHDDTREIVKRVLSEDGRP
jgi:CheY-like chemotaxis protein